MNLTRAFIRNPVAATVLMALLLVVGSVAAMRMRRELFPVSAAEEISIEVAYPGATPDDVDRGITRRIERELGDVAGIEELRSRVLEGVNLTIVKLERDVDENEVLNDLRGELDRLAPDLPEGAEEPEIALIRPFFPVIGVVLSGDVPEAALVREALALRNDLLTRASVSQVLVSGARQREIWVEVEPGALEVHRLTLEDVGRTLQGTNLDVPGGQLRTNRGNVRVRTLGELDRALAIEDLVIRGAPDGSTVRLRDLGSVVETFEDRVEAGRFGSHPAILVTVFKTPEQDAIAIADAVKAFVAERPTRLGGAIRIDTITDLSRFVVQRIDLMTRSAIQGLVLVAIALALFLDLRVAFWVAFGLPVSFLGSFFVMERLGSSFNLISLFGMIIVLGLLVDDAIVVAESVFSRLRRGEAPETAASEGTRAMTGPVLGAVLTTVAAFVPLAFIDGTIGAFLKELPIVVISALTISLLEAFLILPSHLAHMKPWPTIPGVSPFLHRLGEARHRVLEVTFPNLIERVLRVALRWRYVTASFAVASLLIAVGLVQGGFVQFVFIQDSDAETVVANLEMAAGTPESETKELVDVIERAAHALPETGYTFAVIGSSFTDRGPELAADPATVGQVTMELMPAEDRKSKGLRASKAYITAMKEAVGLPPGVVKLNFEARAGGPVGRDIELRLKGDDIDTLGRAAAHVRSVLSEYDGVSEIEDDLRLGKLEVRYELSESARHLGLTTQALGSQIRNALYGFEVQEFQESDDEVKVRVLLPERHRRTAEALSALRLTTPSGGRVPLGEAAQLTTGRGYAELNRVDGRMAVTVRADVDDEVANTRAITGSLAERLADLDERFPGVAYSFEGQRKQTQESLGSLAIGFPVALLAIYVIVAIIFRSYLQPLLVMMIIPFGFLGAIVGHYVMDFPITILSIIGGVALTGVVVNDSLILVDHINQARREGVAIVDAVIGGARTRLRAILLTSVTTCAGMAPLLFERSFQAQFLIPMAISLVFGLAFTTVLVLVLLPVLYLVLADLGVGARWLLGRDSRRRELDMELPSR